MMLRRSALILLLLLLPAAGLSQSPVYPTKLESSPTLIINQAGSWETIHKGAEFRKVTFVRTEPYHLIELKMVRFDIRRIIPRIVQSVWYNLKAADVQTLAEKSGAIATINANYFDELGRPLGFLKSSNGKTNQRISRSSLFDGIFGIKGQRPFIMDRDRFSPEDADEGLQTGPLLIIRGVVLSVTRGAGRQNRRSLIGIDKDQHLIIAATDSFLGGLTWVEVQEFFASKTWQVETTDLLNLDGGGSTQLYVKGMDLEELVPGTTNVPVAIGFFPKTD
jgi:uncharacterized protein YigE (DUF2233 family)